MDEITQQEIWNDFLKEIQNQEEIVFSEIKRNQKGNIPPWITRRGNTKLGVNIIDFANYPDTRNMPNAANNIEIERRIQIIIGSECRNLHSSDCPVVLIIYSDSNEISTPMMERILEARKFDTILNTRISEVYFVLSYEPDGMDGRHPYIRVRINLTD